ncbi:hypothetical protein [Vibrio sonorensis]|uniref:hypothetical protein n=1 Tax=Vibrio sonorensis TaxID=1004316 RepID=UPI0011143E17|nr:hypothetical protein [Vibrio sonorensis]
MLYKVILTSPTIQEMILETNSFSKARRAYLTTLNDKSLEYTHEFVFMACSGEIINQNSLTDQLSPSKVRSY